MTKIILGLGNPGSEYAHTRHNIGFLVADELARRHSIRLSTRRNRSRLGEGSIDGIPVVIAKPQTYMNASGEAALSLATRYRVRPEAIVVVCDDMNLAFGQVRVRASGSAGGHNGLKSILATLGTDTFARVRVGIGCPTDGEWIDFVLGEFTEEERAQLRAVVERAADAVGVAARRPRDRGNLQPQIAAAARSSRK